MDVSTRLKGGGHHIPSSTHMCGWGRVLRPLIKKSFDMFKFYLNSIHGHHVKFSNMANLSRLCVDLLEHNFEIFIAIHLYYNKV